MNIESYIDYYMKSVIGYSIATKIHKEFTLKQYVDYFDGMMMPIEWREDDIRKAIEEELNDGNTFR